MDTVSLNTLFFFIFLLICSAIFSASETAFTAISRIQLRTLIEKKIKGADKVGKLLEQPKKLITAILIGSNLVNIAATAIATSFLLSIFSNFGINNLAIEMFLVTAIVAFILLLFGEITPKAIAIIYSETIALLFVPLINGFMFLFSPIIYLFEKLTNCIHQVFGVRDHIKKHHLTEEEFRIIVNMGEEAGIIETKERQMINSIFEFSRTIVREIMTPRTDAVLLDINTSLSDAIHRFIEIGHSRIPVYDGKMDNIIGIVHAKELLSVPKKNEKISLRNYMREAVFIPETQNIEQLLQQMKKNKFHMAIVVDEYGGVSGIVTLEDIIEEIVGEIQDEYDINERPNIVKISDSHYVIDGKTNIADLPDDLKNDFPENEDYDTIGGFVLYILGKFPQKEEEIQHNNMLIRVKDISKRRILKVEIKRNTDKNEPSPI